ncbi:MAG: hypothetical protein WB471_02395 [Nocardioides sp.]
MSLSQLPCRIAILAATTAALAVPAVFSATSAGVPAVSGPAGSTHLDVSDLATGAPPALAWVERRAGSAVIHGARGTRTPVASSVRELAPMGSGFIVQTGGSRPPRTRWIAADGTPGPRTWLTGYGLGVSAKGKAVAFAGKNGRVWSVDQEGDRVFRFSRVPIEGKGRAVTVLGEDCSERTSPAGCAIYVNGHRGFFTTSHGSVDRAPRMRLVSTGRGRYLGGITSISDTGTCSVMLRGWRPVWRTCANRVSVISSDNRHVVGLPAYGDGFGPTALDLLRTRDGSIAHSFTSSRRGTSATYFDEAWEDAEHLLVVTHQEGEWAIVRLGLDGSMEYAVPPRPGGPDLASPFELQSR